MRYFLLDRVSAVDLERKNISGIKCVTLSDPILHDHFPGHPVMPGALILEGVAQLAGCLLELIFNRDPEVPVRRALLGQIDKMKFSSLSIPGDQLRYEAQIVSQIEEGAKVKVDVYCIEELRVSGFINFSMITMSDPRVTEQRLQLYEIWLRGLTNPPAYR